VTRIAKLLALPVANRPAWYPPMQQIADWLTQLGMSEYAQRFADNDVDLSVLPHLTDQDLKELGVSLGHRRKMLAAIHELGSPHATQSASVEVSRAGIRAARFACLDRGGHIRRQPVEATATAPDPDPFKISDLGEAGFGHQLFDDKQLIEAVQRTLEVAVAGLMLAMPIGDIREIEAVGKELHRGAAAAKSGRGYQ
jgi:SAM domain (Sterile alpha motif)